jgi:PAS domain S-box-containing protein
MSKRIGSAPDVRGLLAFLETLVAGILLCVLNGSVARAQPDAKNVLVIYSYFNRGANPFLDTIESCVRAGVPEKVNFYVTYPESSRWDDEAYRESLAETLRRQYGGLKLDLVMAVSYPALQFTLQYRDKMFHGVPIVITGIGREWLVGQKFSGVTGVAIHIGIPETIDLALRLHPDADTVAVIASDSKIDWAVAHSELLRHKVKEIDIIGPPDSQMLERVTALPPHTVVLFQVFASESTHPAVGVYDVLDAVASRFPTYSAWPNLALGHGGVGGAYLDPMPEPRLTGEISARVLSGERADDIPIVFDSGLQVRVDWRALQRWHIPESALPQGSVILNRPPSLWERYRNYVIASTVVIVVLLLLIIGLLWQRARERKAETVLRESEERFRVMANTTPSLVWMCDPQGRITYLNERRISFTGRDPAAGFEDLWTRFVHPDDRRNVQDVFSQALEDRQPFSNEYRLRRSDGVYRWMFDVASPRLNGDGSFAGFIGSAIDVTDQKLAQQALEKVSGQLIEAQENERRRIARDLHDDICQRLALLSMELDQANRSANESADVTKQRLKEIRQHCSEIAGDVQSLSHELHSSRLDYLGIVAAIRGFCHEFSKQHEVIIECTGRDVPAELPRDVSLCLFRVAQEALHNAVKYSGVTKYSVELRATAGEIQLLVSDAGKGFDVEAEKGNRGLGLVSMQERVHLVRGSLFVESEPGQGTKILAIVPLVSEAQRTSEGRGMGEPEKVSGPV